MTANEFDAARLAPLGVLFQRLSDPTRLSILLALADGGELSCGDLALAMGVSRTTVGRHLSELARMGLVIATGEGLSESFRLHPIVRSADGTLNLGRGVRVAPRPV